MRAHGARAPMFASFRVPSFRFQWPADLLTSWAFEMENLILGWYVLVETGSVLWLTVFGALQYLGTLIAPMMGVTSDRSGPRNLLIGMRAIYALLAATLMTFAFAGARSFMVEIIQPRRRLGHSPLAQSHAVAVGGVIRARGGGRSAAGVRRLCTPGVPPAVFRLGSQNRWS